MTNVTRTLRSTALLLIVLSESSFAADLDNLNADGWHTWRVQAVQSAPAMCCFSSRNGVVSKRSCDLDNRNGGFTTSSVEVAGDNELQVYALMKSGQASRVRALSASCPVTANSAIADLGAVPAGDSVAWLKQHICPDGKISSDVIAAIAVHDGNDARKVLVETASNGPGQDNREEAIFWMGQARISETANDIKRFMFDDANAGIREQAAFSYSQSKASDVSEVLIRQGRTDRDGDVRGQAWFWLAQTQAIESEQAIVDAIQNDKDGDVREEAVFALSQLPADRAAKALLGLVKDRDVDKSIREEALFWLAQSDSDEAFEYVDELLSEN